MGWLGWVHHLLGLGIWGAFVLAVNHNLEHPALPMVFNPSKLSITSVQFNPNPGEFSDWVVTTFGERGVFHNRSYDARLRKKLAPNEITEREQLFKKYFQLPPTALKAACSFEFFGYVPVNTHRPFTWGDKEYRPSIGMGSVVVDESEEWQCYYRGLYENPLHSLTQYRNQHWPIVFFCPALNDRISCANALAANEQARTKSPPAKLPLRVILPVHNDKWMVDLAVDLNDIRRKEPPQPAQAVLCTAIPYSSSMPDRYEPNGAMLYEFIRYHTELGLRVMVYDRRGLSWPYMTPLNYYTRRGRPIQDYDFDYFNYTILDQLSPYSSSVRAESLQGLTQNIIFTDFDKRFTITHCRFAARALYGIERVLVLDFDEFVYCSSAAPQAKAQRQYLSTHMDRLKEKGIEQYVMRQRVQVSRTPDMQQCFFDQVEQGKKAAMALTSGNLTSQERIAVGEYMLNASIFYCLGAYRHLVRRNFDKSFHLAHVCPYTSFHHSSNLRHFDCVATMYRDFDKGCHAIHFSTKPPNYNRTHEHSLEDVLATPSELQLVTNGLDSPLLPAAVRQRQQEQLLRAEAEAKEKMQKRQHMLKRLRREKAEQRAAEEARVAW